MSKKHPSYITFKTKQKDNDTKTLDWICGLVANLILIGISLAAIVGIFIFWK